MLTISFLFNYCLFLVLFNLGWLLTKPKWPGPQELVRRMFWPLLAAILLTALDQLRLAFIYKTLFFVLFLAAIYFHVLKKRRKP